MLPIATATRLGGVKVPSGSGLKIDSGGNLSVDTATEKETGDTIDEVFGGGEATGPSGE